MKILNQRQEDLLDRERQFLVNLKDELAGAKASESDLDALEQSVSQLDDLFLLVMVGEFNAGKSAVINALLGEKFLAEGLTPTTTQINILRYGKEVEQRHAEKNRKLVLLPVDLLSEISIVDTPGTNAVLRHHEELTKDFVPRADLVLFITSVDRPFTESERTFMAQIRDWGKKVLIVVNKIDIPEDEKDLEQVEDFVRDNARDLLGITPEVFMVSARLALRAKQGESQLWERSRFGLLEDYIQDTLDQKSRLKLKLLNPLGVSEHVVEKISTAAQAQRKILDKDLDLLDHVEQQQIFYKKDKAKEFSLRMAEIENIFLEMEQRGEVFFEDRFRVVRIFDLIKKAQLKEDFEREVINDVPQQIERKVDQLVDWLVESDLRQWKSVTDYVAERQREHKERIISDGLSANFMVDRRRLLDEMKREAEDVVQSYDKHLRTEKVALDAQNAVAASFAIEIGAVGLGTIITVLATTAAADITGIVAASVVAVLGLFIIPAQRRKAKRELHDRLSELRTNLIESLRRVFEEEMKRSVARIEGVIAPYSRFVRTEQGRVDEVMDAMQKAESDIAQLRYEIEQW
ncbi:MAG: dynamin family protein [Chloroflexota bacterium]|jgi:small GTP-binding protein|nr:dynamin family protein [Chloroflexota bacterium]